MFHLRDHTRTSKRGTIGVCVPRRIINGNRPNDEMHRRLSRSQAPSSACIYSLFGTFKTYQTHRDLVARGPDGKDMTRPPEGLGSSGKSRFAPESCATGRWCLVPRPRPKSHPPTRCHLQALRPNGRSVLSLVAPLISSNPTYHQTLASLAALPAICGPTSVVFLMCVLPHVSHPSPIEILLLPRTSTSLLQRTTTSTSLSTPKK
jgi:hypothetical protein